MTNSSSPWANTNSRPSAPKWPLFVIAAASVSIPVGLVGLPIAKSYVQSTITVGPRLPATIAEVYNPDRSEKPCIPGGGIPTAAAVQRELSTPTWENGKNRVIAQQVARSYTSDAGAITPDRQQVLGGYTCTGLPLKGQEQLLGNPARYSVNLDFNSSKVTSVVPFTATNGQPIRQPLTRGYQVEPRPGG